MALGLHALHLEFSRLAFISYVKYSGELLLNIFDFLRDQTKFVIYAIVKLFCALSVLLKLHREFYEIYAVLCEYFELCGLVCEYLEFCKISSTYVKLLFSMAKKLFYQLIVKGLKTFYVYYIIFKWLFESFEPGKNDLKCIFDIYEYYESAELCRQLLRQVIKLVVLCLKLFFVLMRSYSNFKNEKIKGKCDNILFTALGIGGILVQIHFAQITEILKSFFF